MAKGTTIEKLFLSLGLDMTALDADLLTASKTVNQGMADLKIKTQQAKLKMEIDMSQFKGAETSTEALTAKTKHLTDQLTIQKQAVLLMNAAYAESVQAKGADDAVSQRILTRLLREQKAEADLAAQIKQTNAARTSGSTTGSVINTDATNVASAAIIALAGGLGRVKEAGQSAGNSIMALNSKIIALTAIAASGAGLFNLVKGAVEAGDSAYKLSSRLNISAAEAGNLNRMLKLSDVDSQSFISTMIRLDRSVTTAGKGGNVLTDAMQLFNFSLTDSNKSLLPINQQLEQLAKGYQNAAKAGEEEAFTADVLGARGAALVPILRDYTINAEAASRVKTIGINPEQAHQLAIEFKVLNMETAQMGNALGMALMPIAKELLPSVISGFDYIVTSIKDNKDEIISVTNATIDLLGEVKKIGSEVADVAVPALKSLFNLNGINSTMDALKELQLELRVLENHPVLGTMGLGAESLGFGSFPKIKADMDAYKAEAKALIDSEKEAATTEKAIKNAQLADIKAAADAAKKIAEDEASAVIQVKKKEMDSAKANGKALIELSDEVYKSTHTQFENELHDIDAKEAALVASGVSEATALNISEARKKIIIDKNNKEIQKSVDEMDTTIFKLTHSSLESRLRDIDTERQAWIKKTGDEVKGLSLRSKKSPRPLKMLSMPSKGKKFAQ